MVAQVGAVVLIITFAHGLYTGTMVNGNSLDGIEPHDSVITVMIVIISISLIITGISMLMSRRIEVG